MDHGLWIMRWVLMNLCVCILYMELVGVWGGG